MSKYLHKSPLSNICTNHSLRYIHSVNISRCTSNSDLAITSFGAMPPHLPGLLPIVCDGQYRPVRRWPLFGRKRPFASWGGGGGGGYVATGPNLSISNRCDFDRFFRVTTCQQPRRLLHVSSRRRRRRASGLILMHRFN